MKNKLFEEKKLFFLGYLVFGTFMKRWPDRLKVLQKRKEENPVIANEIDAAIKTTTASMQKFKDAAEKYKAAAKNAKEQYDNQSGVTGKVKGFFGLEQGDPDKKNFFWVGAEDPFPFRFSSNPSSEKRLFSMNDILSPDFNIGLFLNPLLEGDALKEEVMDNLLGFRKYYDPKSSSKISNEEIEGIQDETLDTFNPFEVFNPAQQESLIKENEELSGTMLEIKNICKPKAQKAFTKFQQSMKSDPTRVNLMKQKKILINNPYYAMYRNFGGYEDGQGQLLEKFPQLLEKALSEIYKKLYNVDEVPEAAALNRAVGELKDGKYTPSVFTEIVKNSFGDTTKSQKSDEDALTAEEKKKIIPVFTKKAKEFIDNLQRIVPVFKIAEVEGNPLETTIEISSVYSDPRSNLSNLFKLDDLTIIKQIVQKTKPDFANFTSEDILGLANKLKKAKRDRDIEVYTDLNNMKKKADLAKSKVMSKNLEDTIQRIVSTKNVTDKDLKIYKRALEWLQKFKQPGLFTNNDQQRTELEEQIIKLIKPLLREKFKRKQNG
tara:strand:+ start:24 stop:1664 length:1641 start_codon:yes stop_codon:yes gene_type:complete